MLGAWGGAVFREKLSGESFEIVDQQSENVHFYSKSSRDPYNTVSTLRIIQAGYNNRPVPNYGLLASMTLQRKEGDFSVIFKKRAVQRATETFPLIPTDGHFTRRRPRLRERRSLDNSVFYCISAYGTSMYKLAGQQHDGKAKTREA